jgi:hypothetical protein
MPFNLSANQAIVNPAGFGEVMGGFVGPAEILKQAPFQSALAQKRALDAGIFNTGLEELGANQRTKLTVDAQLQVVKEDRKNVERRNRLAGLTALMGAGSLFGGGAQPMAGQVFGVGGRQSDAIGGLADRISGVNDNIEQLARFQNNSLFWSGGSREQTKTALGSAPRLPAVGK